MAGETRTTCPYCGVGCGVIAKVNGDGAVSVRGDPDHPANFGRLCSKGTSLAETLSPDGRLTTPSIGGREASWDEALDLVAARFSQAIRAHGPDSVAFYVSGQLLTEDYYVANKLMKGFIGSANIDTNSRLCMASSVAGHKRAFGEDVVPGNYLDLEEADLAVLVGSNLAWCHPILHQRLMEARARRGTRLIVIDPRRSATAADADLHLALEPGTDVLLFNGLLAHLARERAVDGAYVDRATSGFEAALAAANADAPTIAAVSAGCGLEADDIARFFDWFAATKRTVTIYSQGVNQSTSGTDKVNAIVNCHLATARIGLPGAGPFSVTGQPNAMGGREVGGLANQLAAHMGFDNDADIDRVARFWQAPGIARKPGLKAVDMFEAVGDGRIKALWVMGTNPAASMPDAARVRAALRRCDFVAVSDVTATDTTAFAHVLLPAAGWGEKDGTVTNSERRISRQRAFRAAPGDARPDWRIVTEVARRMGFSEVFAYPSRAAVFREHAALSTFENDGARLFDIGGLAEVSDEAYEALPPLQWPACADAAPDRLMGGGKFPTPDGRARFVPVGQRGPHNLPDLQYPFALSSGRLRDQWHTMTRTGRVPRLMANAPQPALDLDPGDAARLGLEDGDIARLETRFGSVRVPVRLTAAQAPGQLFLPMHWSGRFASNAAAGSVSTPAADPVSGQPELKHVPARLAREAIAWHGLLLTRRDIRPTGLVHWSRSAVDGGWAYELAGTEPPDQGVLLARSLLNAEARARLIEYDDRRAGVWRAAALDMRGALSEALLVAAPRKLPSRDWLAALFAAATQLTPDERRNLLSGRAPIERENQGRVVCACFGIGETRIAAAARDGCRDVDAIGHAVQAGTNCGSCRSEIREIIEACRMAAAGEQGEDKSSGFRVKFPLTLSGRM